MSGTKLTARVREQMTQLFGDRANYVTLKDGTKEPTGTYRQSGKRVARARVYETPLLGNYGVIPVRDFFILDIDVHKADIKISKQFFEEFLGVKFSEAFVVKTPSGGYHYYFRVPPGISVFNGSLRPYAKQLAEMLQREIPTIDADLRSSDATGYVVGPGAYIDTKRDGTPYETPGFYTLEGKTRAILRSGDFHKIPIISDEAATILNELRVIQMSKRATRKTKKETEATPDEDKVESIPLDIAKVDDVTLTGVLRGLNKKIRENPNIEFHRRRAYVSAVMRCCFSDYTIATACGQLGVDKDSYTSRRLSMWELLHDLQRLRVNNSHVIHSPYCKVGQAKAKDRFNQNEKTQDDFVRETKAKLASRTFAKNFHRKDPKVIHMTKVFARLEVEKKAKVSQQAKDAILLLDLLFQPLLNVGASRVVVASSTLSKELNLTKSRMTAALRLLRDKKIVKILNRQKTGLAPTYVIEENYIHRSLTAAIKYQWLILNEHENYQAKLLFDRFTSTFIDLRNGSMYDLLFEISSTGREELMTPPEFDLDIFVKRYLAKELT